MSDGQPAPLKGGRLAITALALALGTFMQVLDLTIANVSLPTIAGNLGVSSDSSTWIITSFAVANGVSVPLTGWLMGRYGVVRVFILSVIAFTIASLLCGIAWNLPVLIIFRVLQGGVSGPMVPGSQALLISIFPPEKRSTGLGIWSITTLVAPIAGPVLGGYISDNYHWSWIFLINIPFGVFVTFVIWRTLTSSETPTRRLPIDRIGLLLLVIWVGALQITLDLGKNADWFNDPMIVVLSLIALVGFLTWLIWELTDAHPIVDLSLFANRNFMLGTTALCLGFAVYFGNIVLLPLWLQTQLGYTATWAGLSVAPSGIVAIIFTPLVTRLMSRIDVRWIASASFLAIAASYVLRSDYTTQIGFWALAMASIVQGIGVSGFFISLLAILLSDVPPHQLPSATGLSNFARITLGSFAASLTTTLWDRRETFHQSRLVEVTGPWANSFNNAVGQLGHLGLRGPAADAAIQRQILDQAYLLSTDDLYWAFALLTTVMVALVWLTRRANGGHLPIAVE